MDRLAQLRGGAGGSGDSSLDTSTPSSEAYVTANESSKYFSLSEEDSSFDISPMKDVSPESIANSEKNITETGDLIPNLTPIPKKSDLLDSYKIGKQIEAANILSGGVNIFDDNDNSYDGDELVIDDNADEVEDKSNSELKLKENTGLPFQKAEESESTLGDSEAIGSKDTEVVLQIDGRNVNAIDIGNGLYLYRKVGEEELAAVQIIDDDQQPSFKFLKVRENAEGNLEVYEEIEIEVPKEVPAKEVKTIEKNASHVPIKDINQVITDPTCNKVAERKITQSVKEIPAITTNESTIDTSKDLQAESKSDVNLNGKMVKFNETRKSPVIHSTPNKEGIPLTKTMVDLHLHPNRHSDKVKTIEVHTDSSKSKHDAQTKSKDYIEENKTETISTDKEEEKINDNSTTVTEQNVEIKESEQLLLETDVKGDEKHDDKTKNEKSIEECSKEDKMPSDLNLKNDIYINKDLDKEQYMKVGEKLEISKEDQIPMSLKTIESGNEKKNEKYKVNKINADKNTFRVEENIKEIETLKDITPNVTVDKKNNRSTDENVNADVVDGLKTQQMYISEHRNEDTLVDKVRESSLNSKEIELVKQETVKVSVESKANNDKTHHVDTFKESSTNKQLSPALKDISITTDIIKKTEVSETENAVKEPKPNNSKNERYSGISLFKTDEKSINIKKDQESKLLDLVTKKSAIDCSTIISKENEFKTELANKEKGEKLNEPLKKLPEPIQNITENKTDDKNDVKTAATNIEHKPINNNHTPVPFGQWTEANRQEFLNKIKESKVTANTSNTKQLKQPNDLNRRDILQKIDSQRQSNIAIAKVQELNAMHLHKLNVKTETKSFAIKPTDSQETKVPLKNEATAVKIKPIPNKKMNKPEPAALNPLQDFPNTTFTTSTVATMETIEPPQRKEINNQDLIDKTIEGIINRALPAKTAQEDTKQSVEKETIQKDTTSLLTYQSRHKHPSILDAIEMKMNELHGIPFVERPAHELPHAYNHDIKTYTKNENPKPSVTIPSKIPTLLPYTTKSQIKLPKENVVEIDSEEEVIEHEPITGDIELSKKNVAPKILTKPSDTETVVAKAGTDISKKEPIITENEFDRFARRNSITYENCLTVNFEGNQPHNVIQTVVEKDIPVKKYSRNEMLLAEAKVKSTHKQLTARQNKQPSKIQITSKLMPVNEDAINKNYQSKLKIAYQTTLTAKRQMEPAITIIEDKPVQVVFMDSNSELIPSQLNVQGKYLSPTKKPTLESEIFAANTCDSGDLEVLETIEDDKAHDEAKSKSKHQRKQVLTPVETPELELIEPTDLLLRDEVSPKKKRKIDDNKSDKSLKNLVPKKTYLLGRTNITEDKETTPTDLTKNLLKEAVNQNHVVITHNDAASAIDNLVKAAELIETQSERLNTSTNTSVDSVSQQNTPVKRGRGRPRKYPLPEGVDHSKVPSPQKKPRLMDAKLVRREPDTDEEDTSDDELIKENWTMGKINQKIVCPICHKLFRSESVVFKHVKHCSGPSPNRSDSDKRSSRRSRQSLESESKSQGSRSDDMDIDEEQTSSKKDIPKKRKSKDSVSTAKSIDVIVIEDSPYTEKVDRAESKQHVSRQTVTKAKVHHRTTNLECEICGKTFRQLSYLVSHKLQHNKEDSKKTDNETQTNKSVFSCEVCKKEFRKLHHLAQHRIIHNPSMPSRSNRKSSSEQNDNKTLKEQDKSKQNDDQSAAFRCEPCDKSFRKLHHLVEHRETHDGINRQKNNSGTQATAEKPATTDPPQCDVCKKKFRKLHHLIEHKEQHLETNSEKSDDKSVKSSLSTRDIINECSLCYMVFPNEHSLNKHTIICQRKKRQSAAKQAKKTEETETADEGDKTLKPKENKTENDSVPKVITDENKDDEKSEQLMENTDKSIVEKSEEIAKVNDKRQSKDIEIESVETKTLPNKRDIESINDNNPDISLEIPAKVKKIEDKAKEEVIKIDDTPKKVSIKDKVPPTVTKRQKSLALLPQINVKPSPKVELNDDDEVRYMLNPDFEPDDKLFLQIRAKRRDSLSFDRPNSKDLANRRTSLQQPPKISRLRPKSLDTRTLSTSSTTILKAAKSPKMEPVLSTDSDDSDVKYSFPKTNAEKAKAQDMKSKEIKTPKEKRKSLVERQKTLSGIAKRKSLGKPVTVKHKANPPTKPIRRRTAEVEHRCDCGQLFSSAALLSRHTSLAHTPPRIRRRRSPLPAVTKPTTKPYKSIDKPKTTTTRKASAKSDTSTSQMKSRRKSNADNEQKIPVSRKSIKADKGRRIPAHRGVPVPEKMKKAMEKLNKK